MSSRKYTLRNRRKVRIRSKVNGTAECPRLSVYRSNRAFSAQLINDETGVTIASALVKQGNIEGAKAVADILSKKYTGKCVFDRNGYAYHGRVKEFADHARTLGFEF